jgi:hypothetical protein
MTLIMRVSIAKLPKPLYNRRPLRLEDRCHAGGQTKHQTMRP